MSDAMETIVPMLAPGHTAAELEATPKPDELPDAVDTTSIPVMDPRAESSGLTVGQGELILQWIDEVAVAVKDGDWTTYERIAQEIGHVAGSVRQMLALAAPAPTTSRVQYTVRWDGDDGPLLHTPKNTIREAQDVLDAGVIVQRTVTTTAWTEVAS